MGVLKAWVGGAWVNVGTGTSDEVFVGATDPGTAYELWFDTDATTFTIADIDGGTPASTGMDSIDGGPP